MSRFTAALSREPAHSDHGVFVESSRKCVGAIALVCCLAGTVCLTACGAGGAQRRGGDPVVVSVAGTAIDKGTVEHWQHVFALGGPTTGPHPTLPGSPRQQALAFLISADWLIDEAAHQHLALQEHAIEQALEERRRANGGAEFGEVLRADGQTMADVNFEIRAELAAKAIQQLLTRRASGFTQAELATYYRRHLQQFYVRETRITDLIEQLSSRAAASALVKRIGTGARFAKRAFRESLQLHADIGADPERANVERAIFKARAGVASSPMKLGIGLGVSWTVFVVRRIIPGRFEPLSAVRATARHLFADERERTLAAEYLKTYRRRWTAVTSCSSGFVAQGCAQYRGALRAEPNPFSVTDPILR
jgi:hypothetical protein